MTFDKITDFPFNMIDLTHTLDANAPSWFGDCGYRHWPVMDYQQPDSGYDIKFRLQKLEIRAGIGTHIDVEAHCVPGGMTVEGLSLEELVAPCICIDVSHKVDAYFKLSVDDVLSFERDYGPIAAGSFVIVRTDWSLKVGTPAYHNNFQFPGISEQAAEFLLERDIVGVGIDSVCPDTPGQGFPVHRLVLGARKYIIENIACADKLPPVGSYTMAMPIKASGLVEAPIRLIGLIKKR